MLDGTPGGAQRAFFGVPGGGGPYPATTSRNPARRVSGILFVACAVIAAVNAAVSATTPTLVIGLAHAAVFAVAAVTLLVGHGAVGGGIATAVGFMVFGEYVALLSFDATDRFDLVALGTALIGLAAGITATSDRTPPVRSATPLGWTLAAAVAGFGTVIAVDLPWYHLGGNGPISVDCCAISDESGWPMFATFARLFFLAMLLVWVIGSGRTTRSTGGYLGIALAGLVAMVSPVYDALTVPDMSPQFGLWLGVAVFLVPLLYGLAGLRRSLPPPTAVSPSRLWKAQAERRSR
jgi:hypothetical protein